MTIDENTYQQPIGDKILLKELEDSWFCSSSEPKTKREEAAAREIRRLNKEIVSLQKLEASGFIKHWQEQVQTQIKDTPVATKLETLLFEFCKKACELLQQKDSQMLGYIQGTNEMVKMIGSCSNSLSCLQDGLNGFIWRIQGIIHSKKWRDKESKEDLETEIAIFLKVYGKCAKGAFCIDDK